MNNILTKKEKEFCLYYSKCRNPRLAAAVAGYGIISPLKGHKLLQKAEIKKEIERLDSIQSVNQSEIISGYRQLIFGSYADAFSLIFSDSNPSAEEIEKMDLFCISEIKKPKGGGIEVKFFDKIKALEKLYEISSDSRSDEAVPFYEALKTSAAALRDDDNEE